MSSPQEQFIVRYWGVRASIPTPGPETVRYGGNTTCIEIRCDDQVFIIDTGTGVRELGNRLIREQQPPHTVKLFYSHLHMDHIQGFPFFAPLYMPSTTLHIYSPRPSKETPRQFMAWHMAFPWFPVELEAVPSTLESHDVPVGESLEVCGVKIETCPLLHPGGAMAIRINHRGHAFVQASDHEHDADNELHEPLVELARNADYLSYDSTYTPGEEYERYRGWGHSTWEVGTRVADAASVETFIAFHHDPAHDDDHMDQIAFAMDRARPGSLVAREGMTLDLLDGTVTLEPHRIWALEQ